MQHSRGCATKEANLQPCHIQRDGNQDGPGVAILREGGTDGQGYGEEQCWEKYQRFETQPERGADKRAENHGRHHGNSAPSSIVRHSG
jgi:hypothetical protein